ncbi:MAG TPA: RecQ family zinc-binding domain-containing protein, partial [Polyangiaceae bacterium]|nr:RecQ family zinc-binding domain-containing protein [Polyangiaceae bacterium]
SDVRHRFSRVAEHGADVEQLVTELAARFARRESSDIERIQQVLALAHTSGCLTNALVAHFGEQRAAPCGHCSGCASAPSATPPRVARPGLEPVLSDADRRALRALAADHPQALEEPRQLARFLCGLTSPATTRVRLTRNASFGLLAEHGFRSVMELAERTLAK